MRLTIAIPEYGYHKLLESRSHITVNKSSVFKVVTRCLQPFDKIAVGRNGCKSLILSTLYETRLLQPKFP